MAYTVKLGRTCSSIHAHMELHSPYSCVAPSTHLPRSYVQVALVGGQDGARSEAQRRSWEAKSSGNIDFWHIRKYGDNGVPNSMNAKGQLLYKLGLIKHKSILKHQGLHMEALQAKDSEEDPPFIGADIAGVFHVCNM